jgi:VWFA-related protein
MRRAVAGALSAALLAAALADEGAATLQDEALAVTGEEITTHLVQIVVEVEGVPSRGLKPASFVVEDDGRAQQVVTVSSGELPFTALLVLDASSSMAGEKLELVRRAARRFANGRGPFDRVGLVTFADRPRAFVPVDGPRESLDRALAEMTADGGTALVDALFLAALTLEREPGHRAVVLVSDGSDLHSYLEIEDLRSALRSSRAQLFWIRPGLESDAEARQPLPGSWRTVAEARAALEDLERLVAESGGRMIEVANHGQLDRGVDQALRRLRARVAIGYAPHPAPGTGCFRAWTVRLRDGRGRVHAPVGWFDPASNALEDVTP